jgi:pimeloyl-ACP methyl ester carboxylesterase
MTGFPPIELIGDPSAFRPEAPLILCLQGVRARPDQLRNMWTLFPQCDVLVAPFAHPECRSIAEIARRFDRFLEELGPKPVLKFGLSVGALIAFAMARGDATVAVDPPLQPSAVPRLRQLFLEDQGLADILDDDFRPLLAAAKPPGRLLIAAWPPDAADERGGYVTADDRAWAVRHSPLPVDFVAGSGHNMLVDAPLAVMAALQEALALLPRPELPSPAVGG